MQMSSHAYADRHTYKSVPAAIQALYPQRHTDLLINNIQSLLDIDANTLVHLLYDYPIYHTISVPIFRSVQINNWIRMIQCTDREYIRPRAHLPTRHNPKPYTIGPRTGQLYIWV